MLYEEAEIRGSGLAQLVEALSRKVARSIRDLVIGIIYWRNPSDLTVALGSTQKLTKINIMAISWEVKAAGAWG
jgi:hypothetical protein